jgi:DNA-binding NarL/FixJ family response regulator
LREIIEESPRYIVAAEASDGQSAVRHLELGRFDAAVLDLAMPERGGLQVLEWARQHAPETVCVVLTMYADKGYLDRAFELGARGYLLKDDANDELIRCLDVACAGGTYVSPKVGHPSSAILAPPDGTLGEMLAALTPAQRTVLKLVSEFKTSKEIGRELGISYRTVQNHRANICRALGLDGPNALVEFAVREKDFL